jgi:hypothetical protein
MKLLISRTFEVVTEESAQDGECAESGFVYENQAFTFRDLVSEIESGGFRREGATRWLTSEPCQDFRSGDWQSEGLHLAPGNPPSAEKWFRLAEKFANRR